MTGLASQDHKIKGFSGADIGEIFVFRLVPKRVPGIHEGLSFSFEESLALGAVIMHLNQHGKVDEVSQLGSR